MPLLSELARRKKIDFFLRPIPPEADVLEIGCGEGWVGRYLASRGVKRFVGVSLDSPADIVGDIRDWRRLGLVPESFDYIVAFEVLEHVDCVRECLELLRRGGKLLATSPVPRMDWFLNILEKLGLNQKRTSPHDHLVDFRTLRGFSRTDVRVIAALSQWGIFEK